MCVAEGIDRRATNVILLPLVRNEGRRGGFFRILKSERVQVSGESGIDLDFEKFFGNSFT